MATASDPATPDLDLVLWGATGYTGRLVAKAVSETAPKRLRLALGGRDRERLEKVRHDLGVDAQIIVGEAHDEAGLAAMAGRTRTVISTVGPFARHGTPLVRACVAAGADYADIAGEVTWMRRSIDAFHEDARGSGARIVHACGFDSVPSDLGLLVLQQAALERHGRPCHRVSHVFERVSGGVSGGTVASTLHMLSEEAGDRSGRRALADPDLLAPGAPPSAAERNPWWPRRHRDFEGWTAPFPLAAVNERVVRRSRALLGEPWGSDFRYRERMRTESWWKAAAIGAATVAGPPLLGLPPLRRLAERLAPEPGEGPSDAEREGGSLRSTLVGRVPQVPEPIIVHIDSDHDPAYGATARMLAAVGLALAQDELDAPGGVLTPAVAGGTRLVERLEAAGIHFASEHWSARA